MLHQKLSSTQAIFSLSSGEAEFYGIVKAASVGLGVQATLRDLGVDLSLEIFTDATAAKGIASRKGLGKTPEMMLGKQSHFLIMCHFKEQNSWEHANKKKAGQAKSGKRPD